MYFIIVNNSKGSLKIAKLVAWPRNTNFISPIFKKADHFTESRVL